MAWIEDADSKCNSKSFLRIQRYINLGQFKLSMKADVQELLAAMQDSLNQIETFQAWHDLENSEATHRYIGRWSNRLFDIQELQVEMTRFHQLALMTARQLETSSESEHRMIFNQQQWQRLWNRYRTLEAQLRS